MGDAHVEVPAAQGAEGAPAGGDRDGAVRGDGAADVHCDGVQLALAGGECAGERDPGHEREAVQAHRGGTQLGVAPVQAPEARAGGQFLLDLQRRPDHLALEVHDRVEYCGEGAPGGAVQAGYGLDGGESGGRDGGRAEGVGFVPAGLHRSPPEERFHGLRGAVAEVATEDGVAGVGTTSSCASGIRAATARAPEVGVRRSWAPESSSVGTFGSGSAAGGAGEASGQSRQRGTRLSSHTVAASNG